MNSTEIDSIRRTAARARVASTIVWFTGVGATVNVAVLAGISRWFAARQPSMPFDTFTQIVLQEFGLREHSLLWIFPLFGAVLLLLDSPSALLLGTSKNTGPCPHPMPASYARTRSRAATKRLAFTASFSLFAIVVFVSLVADPLHYWQAAIASLLPLTLACEAFKSKRAMWVDLGDETIVIVNLGSICGDDMVPLSGYRAIPYDDLEFTRVGLLAVPTRGGRRAYLDVREFRDSNGQLLERTLKERMGTMRRTPP